MSASLTSKKSFERTKSSINVNRNVFVKKSRGRKANYQQLWRREPD